MLISINSSLSSRDKWCLGLCFWMLRVYSWGLSVKPMNVKGFARWWFVSGPYRFSVCAVQISCLGRTDSRPDEIATARQRALCWQLTGPNPLNYRDDLSGPALHLGKLNSLFQAAYFYLPHSAISRRLFSNSTPQSIKFKPLLACFGFVTRQKWLVSTKKIS